MKPGVGPEKAGDSGKVLMLFCEPLGGSNGKAFERLKNHATIQAEVIPTPVDALSLILKRGMGVVVFRIQERAHFQLALSMLQALQNGIAQGAVQFVVTSPVSNPQLVDRLRAAGVTEIIQEPVPDRSLAFKLERFAKNIQSYKVKLAQQQKVAERVKKVEAAQEPAAPQAGNPAQSEISAKIEELKRARKKLETARIPDGVAPDTGAAPASAGAGPSPKKSAAFGASQENAGQAKAKGKGKAKAHQLRWGPAIAHESDLWIANECAIKPVGDRWVIRHRGPGPGAGKWVETSGKGLERAHSDTKFYEWTWNEADQNPFIQVPGRWVFCGIRAPDFMDEMWWFSGRRPSLFFVNEGRVQAAKFAASQDGTLIVAKDSARATALLPRFVETWKKGVKVRQKKAGDSEGGDEALEQKRGGPNDPQAGLKERAQISKFGTLIRTPPLPLESDFWTLNVEQTLAREGGVWQVALLGPSSSEGHWVERPSATAKLWVFTPKTKKVAELHREMGEWTISGAVPHFEKGLWIFTGEAPRLDFRAPGGITKGIRFNTRKDQALLVARDSRTAVQLASGLKKEAKGFGFVDSDGEDKKGIEFDYLDRRERKEGALLEAEKGEVEAAAFNDRLKREEASDRDAEDYVDRPEEHGLDLKDRRGPDAPKKGWKRWGGNEGPTREDFDAAIRETTNEMGEAIFEYPELMFGMRGGRFDFITTEVATVPAPGAPGAAGVRLDQAAPYDKIFVFVPVQVLMGKIPDFSSIATFWTYAGLSKPELDLARQLWIFRLERPVEVQGFGNLQPHVQRYLLDLLEGCKRSPELAALPPQPTPVLREPLREEREKPANKADSDEEEVAEKARQEALKRELEEDDEADDEASPDSDEEPSDGDGEPDENSEAEAGKSKAVEKGKPSRESESSAPSQARSSPQAAEGGTLESPVLALRKKRQREQRAAVEAAMESVAEKLPEEVRSEVAAAVESAKKELPTEGSALDAEASKAQHLGTPLVPAVRALGMALYASELSRRRDLRAVELLERLLARWSSSIGGLTLELLRARGEGSEQTWERLAYAKGSMAGTSEETGSFEFESGIHQFRLVWQGPESDRVALDYQKQVVLGLTGLLLEAEPTEQKAA